MSRRWPAFAAREAVLAELERAIAATPAALDTRYYYASFLRDHGRLDDATQVFAAVLSAAPEHVETLIAYGAALARVGRRLDARAALERAVALDASRYVAVVSLANLLSLDDPERAERLYEAAVAVDSAAEPAHRGLCSLYAMRGDRERAARHRAAGYASGPFVRRPYFGERFPTNVLALVSTDGGNTPVDTLVDPYAFAATEVFVEAYRDEPLPPHALIVNAIGDPDRAVDGIAAAERIVARSRARIINPPRAVAPTGRLANAARLAEIEGIVMPAVRRVRAADPPPTFPVIVRAAGFHMGRDMRLAPDAAAYERALHAFAARGDALAIEYVDTRSADGAWRKYRVMLVDGIRYPLHLAIGRRWDVHYFSSAMADDAAFRSEEAAFLRQPEVVLGRAGWDALERVARRLELDYAGIDFGRDASGRIVVFEANAAMTVLPPDPDERFAYRREAAERVHAAVRAMVAERALA